MTAQSVLMDRELLEPLAREILAIPGVCSVFYDLTHKPHDFLESRLGGILEMYQTFNMGMGFALIVPENEAGRVMERIEDAKAVGRVVEASGVRVPSLGIEYAEYL